MAHGFESTATEIQCSIFRLLGPIDLIAASQTCSTFRRIINPQRIHFIERLLALECTPEIGGPSYGYSHWSESPLVDRVAPIRPFSSPAWHEMRFACGSCLRLRKHTLFQYQQLYRLAYRKPPAGTPAAETASSWEPSLRGKKWGRRFRKQTGYDEAERTVRRQYNALLQLYDSHYMSMSWCRLLLKELKESRAPGGFEHMADTALDEASEDGWEKRTAEKGIASIELYRCGYKRRYRQCIECVFQASSAENATFIFEGTRQVPVIKLHQTFDDLQTDRWFPGLLDKVSSVDRVRKQVRVKGFEHPVIARGRWPRHTPIFMARCPGCRFWNELRAFRVFPVVRTPGFGVVEGERIRFNCLKGEGAESIEPDDFICNGCLAEQEGRDVLGKELATSLRFILEAEEHSLKGWILGNLGPKVKHEILDGMRNNDCDLPHSGWWGDFDSHKIHLLMDELEKQRRELYNSRWISPTSQDQKNGVENGYRSTTHDYKEAWFWLADRWKEVGDNEMRGPNGRLVQWALGERNNDSP